MALQDIVRQTVGGLGLELVEIERFAGGLLRVTIDWPWKPGADGEPGQRLIAVEDCEAATRQLQYALEVEGVEYRRLEVSSPGIDRPLRNETDFERFAGEVVDLTLKEPIGADGAGQVAANRKKFRGTIERTGEAGRWRLVWRDEPPAAGKPGRAAGRKKPPAPLRALEFSIDELREARLAPIVDFKGRRGAPDGAANRNAQDDVAGFDPAEQQGREALK